MGGQDESAYEPHASHLPGDARLRLAVCLVSGGMDSCVAAAVANEEADELAFLHVSYGQRTEQRERRAFEQLAEHYKVKKRLVVSLEHLAQIGGSSLTDKDIEVSSAGLDWPGHTNQLCAISKCSSAVYCHQLGRSDRGTNYLYRRCRRRLFRLSGLPA